MKNRVIDFQVFLDIVNLIIWLLVTIINVINIIFIKEKIIIYIALTVHMMIMIDAVVISWVTYHNDKVILRMLERERKKYWTSRNIDIGGGENEKTVSNNR